RQMTTQPLKLGFIGLGIMGAPMAGHLIKAGHQLFVCTHGKVPEPVAGSSATICVTARGVAERADIVFVMVPDTPDVEAVLFALMGKNSTLVGANGDGQTAKVANQIIVALTIEAVGEALLLAARAGADPARVREALMGGFASSKILEVHGDRMVKRSFDPGF